MTYPKMKRGWFNKPSDPNGVRHSLSARGIPNAPNRNHAVQKAMMQEPRVSEDKPKNIEVIYLPDTILLRNKKTSATAQLRYGQDFDGDGIMNQLDCDPLDPQAQGFFDKLKTKVQDTIDSVKDHVEEHRLDKKLKQEERIKDLREELEEKEEQLERDKIETLLKLESKTAEKRSLAEIKTKEKELDNLQGQLEEGTFKQKFKTTLKVGAKRAGILAGKAAKRGLQELAKKAEEKLVEDKKKLKPLKLEKITITEKELEATTPETIDRLEKQKRKNAEVRAKIELNKLQQQERILKEELKGQPTIKKPRTRKKRGGGLFDF